MSGISKLLYVIWDNFEISRVYLCQISRTNHAIICLNYYLQKVVIFTCRYFKLSWNTTALNQSNCRNFSCSSIINVTQELLCFDMYNYYSRTRLQDTTVESHLTATSFLQSLFLGLAKQPYIALEKSHVNAVTHWYGQWPHFKIPNSRIFYNFTPLKRPLIWN